MRVVGTPSRDEDAALMRVDLGEVDLVRDAPTRLDPFMTRPARIGGRTHAKRDDLKGLRLGLSQPAEEVAVVKLRELGQLVEADELEGRRLVAVMVLLPVEVAEAEGRMRREAPLLAVTVPMRIRAAEPLVRPGHDGLGQRQLGVGASEQDGRVAGDVRVLHRRHQERVGLAATGCPAVHALQAVELDECLLLRLRRVWAVVEAVVALGRQLLGYLACQVRVGRNEGVELRLREVRHGRSEEGEGREEKREPCHYGRSLPVDTGSTGSGSFAASSRLSASVSMSR